jgi:hypothetical protein
MAMMLATAEPTSTAASKRRRAPLRGLRGKRQFRRGDGVTIEPLLEIYNVLNENGSITEVEQVGAALGRISRNIDGRLVRISLKVGF